MGEKHFEVVAHEVTLGKNNASTKQNVLILLFISYIYYQRKKFKNMHIMGTLLFCIGRPSTDNRTTIGR